MNGHHGHISHHHHHPHGFMYAVFALFPGPLKILLLAILLRMLWNS